MKRGIYKLTRDVPNPQKIDRRKTTWDHKPVWRAGMKFVIYEDDYADTCFSIKRLHGHSARRIKSVMPERQAFIDTLTEHLVPVDTTLMELGQSLEFAYDYSTWQLIEKLVESGDLKRSALEALLD